VERKEQMKRANPPFTTSTLQQAAANVLGWSGKQTMAVAQQLYEAGMITYHRTDSFNLAHEAVAAAREEIAKRFGAEFVPEKPNSYQTKSKNAQEAHEAIRPTTGGNGRKL
jgi:DNA topoisomerase I